MDIETNIAHSKTLVDFPFHTVLLSIYPILFVYSRNMMNIPFRDTIRFLYLSVGFFVFLLICFRLVLRDWEKAGLMSSLLAALFYSFGHAAISLESWLHNRGITFNTSTLVWVWLVLFLALSFLIVRFRLRQKTTQFLNLVSLFLVFFPVVGIMTTGDVNSPLNPKDSETIAQLRGEQEGEASFQPPPMAELPDIYYIVFDGYMRSDYLEAYFDYDNKAFLDALEERGFYIISSSNANYLNTNYSLLTSLNLVYFHELPKGIFNKTKYNLYTNYVHDFLQEMDYQTVVFDSGTGDTNEQHADYFLTAFPTSQEEDTTLNKFEGFFLRTTMGLLFFSDLAPDADLDQPSSLIRETVNRELDIRRERVNYALRHLPDFADQDDHYFLFSHIYSPHIPFLYGADGEELTYHEDLNLYWYEVDPENYIEYYNYQIDYLNQALLNTIDEILVNSNQPLVIIIQSDHGDEKFLDRDHPTAKGVRVRSGILNAIYFSDQDYNELYPSMTPVNTFRIVFNHWYGTVYPLLEDKVFFHEHPLDTRINEKPAFIDSCQEFEICLPPPPY